MVSGYILHREIKHFHLNSVFRSIAFPVSWSSFSALTSDLFSQTWIRSSLFTAYVLFPVLESTFFLQMVHDFMEISGKFGRTSVITLVLRWRELIQSLTLPNCCWVSTGSCVSSWMLLSPDLVIFHTYSSTGSSSSTWILGGLNNFQKLSQSLV